MGEKINKFVIKLPTLEEIEQMKMDAYERAKQNKVNMSYWLPFIEDLGFNIPETIIIPLDRERFNWLRSDSYSSVAINEFTEFLKSEIQKHNFDTNRKLFIKSGIFSNKFNFRTCKVDDIDRIGKQFLELYYASMIFGADNTAELVVREFIESEESKGKIYEGMPLNTEFRVFYDFDNFEVMGIFNYWDTEVMFNHLSGKDLLVFKEKYKEIEEDYEKSKELVLEEVSTKLKYCKLKGKWSIDFMKAYDKLYLIDMALAEQSYYYNKLLKVRENNVNS